MGNEEERLKKALLLIGCDGLKLVQLHIQYTAGKMSLKDFLDGIDTCTWKILDQVNKYL